MSGESRIIERCKHPLTGVGCCKLICTGLAVPGMTPRGLELRERNPGLRLEELQKITGVALAYRA